VNHRDHRGVPDRRFVGEFAFQELMAKRGRRGVAAAEKSEMPRFIKPQLATLKAKAPGGRQWLNEIKYDGYRVQIHLNAGKKKVYTRNGLDWTKRFSKIAGFPVKRFSMVKWWSSMTAAPTSPNSRPNSPLVNKTGSSSTPSISFGGTATFGNFLKIERKQALADLLGENDIGLPVPYSEHLIGDGPKMFEHAAKLNFEGIVSKNADAP